MKSSGRSGSVLLEVIVALAVLGAAGLSITGAILQAQQAAYEAAIRNDELRRADAFMNAVALWPAADLNARLGNRSQGAWRLSINRFTPTLYHVVLTDSATPNAVLLETTLYRPEQADD